MCVRPHVPANGRTNARCSKLLAIGAAVDALLLNPDTIDHPDLVWAELQPVAEQVGLHFQSFQLATSRVVDRLNLPQDNSSVQA